MQVIFSEINSMYDHHLASAEGKIWLYKLIQRKEKIILRVKTNKATF